MMDAILKLIPGGSLTALIASVLGVLAFVSGLLYKTKQAGINQQKAKEAEARAKNLDRIKHAADAQPNGSVLDDPNNRDQR